MTFGQVENFQKAADGSFAPVSEGDYTVFLKVSLRDNNTAISDDAFLSIKNILCKVRANFEPSNDVTLFSPPDPNDLTDPPEIVNFEVAPQTIQNGESTTLYWWVNNTPEILTIDNGVGNVIDSVRAEVSPTQTTTYTLTASNIRGTVSKNVTVIVEP